MDLGALTTARAREFWILLKPVKLTVWKVVIERIAIFEFKMDNGAGCSEVKIWVDTAKFTDMIVARFRKCRDLVREGKVFIKNKAEVLSAVGCKRERSRVS